jgi:NAD+ kinase
VRGSTAQLGEQADALISLGGDGTAIRRMQAGEALEVRLRPRAGLVVRLDPERYERRRGVKLSLLDLPYLPDEMRDALPAA